MTNTDPDVFEKGLDSNLLEVKGFKAYLRQAGTERLFLDIEELRIKRGKFTALMGRSGIGKSLTIRAILGLLPEDTWRVEGEIIFYRKRLLCPILNEICVHLEEERSDIDDDNVTFEREHILDKNGYNKQVLSELRGRNILTTFQGPDSHLHPSMRIGWQIGETIEPQRPWRRAEEVKKRLEEVELNPDDIGKYPHQFSQGQRQRIMTAMTLGKPDLMIADEPTTALDIAIQRKIIDLLKGLRSNGQINSMLLITHDLKVVEALLHDDDKILVMDRNPETDTISIVISTDLNEVKSGRAASRHSLLSHQDFSWFDKYRRSEDIAGKEPILYTKNLTQVYRYGLLGKSKTVLQNISLTVREGELYGIVGESGCGKTTLAKSIARLLKNTQGEVNFRTSDQEIRDLVDIQPNGLKPDTDRMKKIRKELQVIFQDSASIFNPNLTLRELLSETLDISKDQDQDARLGIMEDTLIQFEICRDEQEVQNILSKYPRELSGGERQRLAIARVFLLKPRLIIADEPFAAQDKITKAEIIRMMGLMRHKVGTTFIVISHDLSLVNAICDTVAIMSNGRIVDIYDSDGKSGSSGSRST